MQQTIKTVTSDLDWLSAFVRKKQLSCAKVFAVFTLIADLGFRYLTAHLFLPSVTHLKLYDIHGHAVRCHYFVR